MRSEIRPLPAVVAGIALSVATLTVTFVVSGPVVAGLAAEVGGARPGSGLIDAPTHRTVSTLTGKANRILLLVRCPIIKNGSGSVVGRWSRLPSLRSDTGILGGP